MKPPLRVLVVEDSEDDCELLLRALRNGMCDPFARRVHTQDSLSDALTSSHWDIIFSEWSMGEFTAIAALEVLKAGGLDLPFVVVSRTVGEDVAVAAIRAGAHDFLPKPNLCGLIPIVERELQHALTRREDARRREQSIISERMASARIIGAGLAHEINNPLAAVLANLDLAISDLGELRSVVGEPARLDEVMDELSDARSATERIRSIVRDLRLFSRSDTDKYTDVDVVSVLESTLRMCSNQIRHRACLVKDYSQAPPVRANESRLAQVFLNLIMNAIQAIPEGRAQANEIHVTVKTEAQGRIMVEISDTGLGMPPEVVRRLFTPFFTTKPLGEGTGLGLSICQRVITSLGGEIALKSEVGKGTTFSVYLPTTVPNVVVARAGASELARAPRHGRVLVIDDESMIVTAVQRALAEDHDVVGTSQPREAIARLSRGEYYDVILCDLMMPDMTGMELHSAVREIAPEHAARVVFLTGGAFTAQAQTFLNEVPNARLEKPFSVIDLRAIVNDHMR